LFFVIRSLLLHLLTDILVSLAIRYFASMYAPRTTI
jgi:hypothetical protein